MNCGDCRGCNVIGGDGSAAAGAAVEPGGMQLLLWTRNRSCSATEQSPPIRGGWARCHCEKLCCRDVTRMDYAQEC